LGVFVDRAVEVAVINFHFYLIHQLLPLHLSLDLALHLSLHLQ
jgi:hypothetical protein